MKSKKLLALSCAICLVLILSALPFMAACAKPAAPPAPPAPTPATPTPPTPAPPKPKPEPVVLKAVSCLAESNIIGISLKQYIGMVNERAKGELIIEYLGGPEVIPMFEQGEAVRTGAVDMMAAFPNVYHSVMNSVRLFEITPTDPMGEREVGIYEFWIKAHEEMMNVRYIGRLTFGQQYYLFLNKTVSNLDDLSGLRIIAAGALAEFAKGLGAVPVVMPWGEVYTSLERKLVDGWITVSSSLGSYKAFDVIESYIDHPFYQTRTCIVANLDAWNRVPKDMQDVMVDVMIELEPQHVTERLQNDKEMFQKCEEYGIKPVKFSADEADRYIKMAYDTQWQLIKGEISPELYAEAQKVFKR